MATQASDYEITLRGQAVALGLRLSVRNPGRGQMLDCKIVRGKEVLFWGSMRCCEIYLSGYAQTPDPSLRQAHRLLQ